MAAGASVDEIVPFIAGIVDARTIYSQICSKLACPCGGEIEPLEPHIPMGALTYTIRVRCTSCQALIELQTGETVKLFRAPELTDEEEHDGCEPEERKRNRKRAGSTTRAILGALLSGCGYREFDVFTVTQRLPGIHHTTWDAFLCYLEPFVEYATERSVDLVRYLVAKYDKSISSLVCTTDTFWSQRGHHAMHSTGTICDLKFAAVLSFKHLSKDPTQKKDEDIFLNSSNAMDPAGFRFNVKNVYDWVCSLEESDCFDPDAGAHFSGIVADGDGSTSKMLAEVKAAEPALANLMDYDCGNHLAKNVGNQAYQIGHEWNKACDCPIKQKADGSGNYKNDVRDHRGCNTKSHPLVKAYQRGFGGALRNARDEAQDPQHTGTLQQDLAIAAVEECVNHLQNIHDGPGFHTGEQRKCRHEMPHTSSQWNDCRKFNQEMQAYITKNFIDRVNHVISEEHGVMTQNASERVGDVAIRYRDKDTFLRAGCYKLMTNLAILHTNQIVIEVFRRMLKATPLEDDEEDDEDEGEDGEPRRGGITDARLEAWGCVQTYLHNLIGLPYGAEQERAWQQDWLRRAKRSEVRRTTAYQTQRASWRKGMTERRNAERQDANMSYKGSTGGASSHAKGKQKASSSSDNDNGVVGACTCRWQCGTTRCPCKAANAWCTPQCHPGSTKCMRRADAGRSAGAGSSSAGAGSSSNGAGSSSDFRLRDDAQAHFEEASPALVGRVIWVNLPPRDDETDLTTFPGGWWEGEIAEYLDDDDPRALNELEQFGRYNVVFYFQDDEGEEWSLNLPLYRETYDPFFDALSEPVDYSWYLVEE